MKDSLSKVQYLLFALLIFALSGCGASNTTPAAIDKSVGSGKITANLVLPKTAGKTVALAADVVKTRLVVTGATIPTARQDFTNNTGGTLEVYPGRDLLVTAQAFDVNDVMIYEGSVPAVTVDSGRTAAVTIQLNAPIIKASDATCINCHQSTRDTNGQNLVANFKQSGHYSNVDPSVSPMVGAPQVGCAGCHGPNHNILNPAASGRCADCHTSVNVSHDTYTGAPAPIIGLAATTCGKCHSTHNFKLATAGCIGCHSIPQNAGVGFVQDNNGVRSITQEFSKWSHHVTGVALNDAHCAACHLEGTVINPGTVGARVVVDPTKHMVDAMTHLRDTSADTDADFVWDPAAPNHSGMDTYCMSCHDANGAVSTVSAQIQAFINANGIAAPGKTASPSNPFGDTISNRYDKMQRPAVVDASSQFNTTNNSHHAVKGKRYTGRTRAAGSRQIGSPATFANNSSALLQGERRTMFDADNFNRLYIPLANAGGEVNVEGTLSGRTGDEELGDDSTLHCGDCHTVGQWRPNGPSTTRIGGLTPAAIGAHGSNNEYLLRNSTGTDERHTQNAFTVTAGIVTFTNPNAPFLVCYNCHAYDKYGSVFTGNGVNPTSNGVGPHAGEYDAAGRCNGVGNTLPFNGYTTGKATDGTQFRSRFDGPRTAFGSTPAFAPGFPLNEANRPAVGEQNPDFGNIFGIQCNNCHNSGVGNGYGGIHGSPNNTPSNDGITVVQPDVSITGGAYIDGLGNTTKVQRFLPGLGNTKYVPGTLGGYTGGAVVPIGTVVGTVTTTFEYTTGGITNDTNWEQRYGDQVLGTVFPTVDGNLAGGVITGPVANVGAGCYTLDRTPATGAAGSNQRGPSVTGAGGAATPVLGTWGGCDDHNVATGEAGERQFKRIVRPVTY